MGEASCHVRTVTGLAAVSCGLAASDNWISTRDQLHPGAGVTAKPGQGRPVHWTQPVAAGRGKCL